MNKYCAFAFPACNVIILLPLFRVFLLTLHIQYHRPRQRAIQRLVLRPALDLAAVIGPSRLDPRLGEGGEDALPGHDFASV